jgi:hypothetical protein
LIAKSATELRDLRIAENTKIKVDNKNQQPEMIPLESVDDEGFIKAMKTTYGTE